MLRNKKAIFAAIFLAAFGSSHVASANNADVSHLPEVLIIDAGKSDFSSTFDLNQKNATFTDNFNFSVLGSYQFAAQLFALNDQFNITHFSLYDQSDNSRIAKGSHAKGNNEIWNLSLSNLAAGGYFLQVLGKLKSDDGPTFSGNLTVSLVPEANVYTMLLAGLGLICFLSRRRPVSEKFMN